jgi:hypothetical protein
MPLCLIPGAGETGEYAYEAGADYLFLSPAPDWRSRRFLLASIFDESPTRGIEGADKVRSPYRIILAFL